jgi:hypothetical protein
MKSEDLALHFLQGQRLCFLGRKESGLPKEEKDNNRRKAKSTKTTRRVSHSFDCNIERMKRK